MELLKNYIHGGWRDSHSSDKLSVIDPGTQETLWEVPLGNRKDIESAVKSASAAA
jgi:acyl-CoA reductase-like NAD-dependent aldehyde dehydrogenase